MTEKVLINKDIEYAKRYWDKALLKGEGFVQNMRAIMVESIEKAAAIGKFAIFVNMDGISEDDKEKISAYRELARELGYEIGPLNRTESGTAVGAIGKLQL